MRVVGLALLLLLLARETHAQLPGNGRTIRTSDYQVDLSQGPVLGGSRVVSLGGAYVAIAEGVDGTSQNPAAPAVRTRWSFDDFDYDLAAGLTFPSTLSKTDFFNTGEKTRLTNESGFVFLDLAANVQSGRWGFGGSLQLQKYDLLRSTDPGERRDKLSAQIGVGHWVLAHTFFADQLSLGAGVRTTGLSVVNSNSLPGEGGDLFSTLGVGVEAGALWRPTHLPIRLGAAVRSELTPLALTDEHDRVFYEGTGDELYLPNEVTLPWEFNFGFALQLGPRRFNPAWKAPSDDLEALRERLVQAAKARESRPRRATRAARRAARALRNVDAALDDASVAVEYERLIEARRKAYLGADRGYVMLAASMLVTGPSENAVGIEAFLDRTVNRSGKKLSISPRVGIESEVVPNWLRLGTGAYLEPTRFDSNTQGARLHTTFGLNLKLFRWAVFGLFDKDTTWGIGGAVDSSRRYLGWGATAGIWR